MIHPHGRGRPRSRHRNRNPGAHAQRPPEPLAFVFNWQHGSGGSGDKKLQIREPTSPSPAGTADFQIPLVVGNAVLLEQGQELLLEIQLPVVLCLARWVY